MSTNIPEDLRYSREHEWVRTDGDGVVTVGVTAFAADSLGDVVFVQLPEAGSNVTAGEVCGEIESTKSVSELYSPVTGEVVELNESVVDSPETVNSDPYDAGWLFKVRAESVPDLLDADAYAALIQEG
ncbi:glycine cleavage system protein GcvH [Saccharomonospora viridis]|uniref:Glycine cleavage system H protein n=2 Tax=Saccharomonospora viridis TaxID=1852 RepID=C7MQ82_SACVD|nr:glycine cleavage system protein GcvH [Saccharomonospora viridis]ACU96381.1 glycine cleavage system H protein [Saccharomonospora viridis DSM 43017]KHF42518.1 glycine cleavage system protein H [Saccharomonospora viridis]SFO97855.1 glycine cleavage system H protein [Saccharomonospora viridis]